jgi:hypothetical protein
MDKRKIKEYLDKGYVHINTMFEIIGNPKEHVEKSMKLLLETIKQNKEILITKEEYGKPEETSDGLWGTFCEAEMLVKDRNTIGWIAFNYVPASMEIIAPEKITFKDKEMTDFIGDLLAQLHETNQKQISLNSVNHVMLKNINALMRNAILIAINNNTNSAAEIGKIVGVPGKDIEPVLEAMIKEGRIEKKGSKYTLKKAK